LTVKLKNQCQGQINLLDGLVQKVVLSNYEDNQTIITKLQSIIAMTSENSIIWPSRSMSYMCQGKFDIHKDSDLKNVSKYAVNPFINYKVIQKTKQKKRRKFH
jgi:hypothetical protein